jgi:hypothetical protein
MAVKIGHASIDERGKISGGKAGDQTGKEVCTRNFYMHAKGWNVLRAKDEAVAEKIAKCMEDVCANPYVGYDQIGRLSLYDTVRALNFMCDINTLKVYVETDCSALVRVCLAYAGIRVNNFTTANEKDVIMATGMFELVTCDKDGENLKRGDILVTKTKGHTVVVLTDGADFGKIKEDGEWGVGTTRATQRVFETVVDGIISSQPMSCKKYLPNAMTTSWKFVLLSKGSALAKAIQTHLKNLGYYTGKTDGKLGYQSVLAMQKFLKELGLYKGASDGYMGGETVIAWQKYINSRL